MGHKASAHIRLVDIAFVIRDEPGADILCCGVLSGHRFWNTGPDIPVEIIEFIAYGFMSPFRWEKLIRVFVSVTIVSLRRAVLDGAIPMLGMELQVG